MISETMLTQLIYIIAIPVGIGITKTLFADEILYWLGVWSVYTYRPFDLDGDTTTPDWCMLFNAGTGMWEYVSITFQFSIFKGENGVYVTRYDPSNGYKAINKERIPFSRWKATQRAHIIENNIPTEIKRLIEISV